LKAGGGLFFSTITGTAKNEQTGEAQQQKTRRK
jgi:hypothetical protein